MRHPSAVHPASKVNREIPLHALLDERAAVSPGALAYRFLPDGGESEEALLVGELAARARILAAGLLRHGTGGGPVLLIHPPGLAFIESLFACWYAGSIAVPAYPPRGGRHRRRFEAILADSGAEFVLAPAGQTQIAGVTVLESESLLLDGTPMTGLPIHSTMPCLLQYTSGSTAEPKGVMISHDNLRSHFASLDCYAKLGLKSALSWLPPYHDMGLVLKILYAFESGIPLTFFSPDQFIQRPLRWLRAISRYRAELSGAPNFAFEMCLRGIRDEELEGLDLSCWKAAPCGAERIRPETLDRFSKRFAPYGFRPEAFLPGYGLAEATLSVTAFPAGEVPRVSGDLVSCGPALPGIDLRIADPATGLDCKDREIGEIRIKGPAVSSGYWNAPEATLETFGEELCTGDLGYLEAGHLFVTGRIKDLIIIDGTNHSPEDIESAAFAAAPEITAAAAFAVEARGVETIMLALEAGGIPAEKRSEFCRKVRSSIGDALEVPIRRIVIVRSGLLPRTTSGKIRRSACRDAVESGSLKLLFDDAIKPHLPESHGGNLPLLLETLAEVTGMTGTDPDEDLVGLGINSMAATRLAALLQERTGAAISLGELFAARSLREIAAKLANETPTEPGLPAIVPGSGTGANVLTHSQERMWFLHQLDPDSAAYHVFGSLEITGPLDPDLMDQAIREVISCHDILCSRHGSENGQPQVHIARDGIPHVERFAATSEKALQDLLPRFARKPFVLADESPIRVCLVACGPGRHVLAICVHHIVADGWSLRILGREIADTYAAHHAGDASLPRPRRPRYLDYAVTHRKWIDAGAVDSQISYWKSILAGHAGVLQLATDFPRPPKQSSDGRAIERILSADLCNRVASLARLHQGTPFMVHLAAFLLLLRRHGAGDDPVVAVPIANRNHAAAGELIGTLVNTLPFRLPLDPAETFSDLLERVREATFGMQAAQDAPFERIIEAVKPDRSRDHSPLAQVMFDYQEIPIAETWAGGLDCRPFIAHRGAVQFDLSLLLTVLNDRQQLSIEYSTDLFRPETAAAMLDRHLATLELASREPARKLSEISGLTETDRSRLADVAQGPDRPDFPQQTTPDLIAKRVALHPGRVAVTSESGTLDYGTLGSRSNQLAANLHERGVQPGDRLAVLLDRNADLVVALLAVWKAGATYVPLDGASPPERLKLILDDQYPLQVLVSPGLAEYLPADANLILFDERLLEASPDIPPHRASPADAAYIIYTSGSTGKPKGVVVSHGALANFLLSMAESPGFTEIDKLLAVTTVSFDISALEIFLPLITGGNLNLVPVAVARDGVALLGRLRTSGATVMQATPVTWRMLLDAGWQGSPDLKILCGGEALDLPLARQLDGLGCQLWNLYGPTETTVWSTLWRVPDSPDSIRIGRPIANAGIHILATDGSPLPPGVTGELWISGAGLADGYWKRPELTARSFVSNRYHTGDLARWHDDGTLECLGRSDGQVKIRGFRVELGEIEAALMAHPAVSQAKVAFRGNGPASRKLIGWIIPHSGAEAPAATKLHEFLARSLPGYMLPADIDVIDSFPLNPNGKVDVSKLANPQTPTPQSGAISPTEVQLSAIWCELLDRASVGREDDWFQIGGHSLLALRLFSRIHRDFQRNLPLSTILEHSTLRDLAAMIDQTPLTTAP